MKSKRPFRHKGITTSGKLRITKEGMIDIE
jgi:hypothetical protein